QRVGVDDGDAGSAEVGEVVDPLRVARADEEDERRAVHHAAERQCLPTPGGNDPGSGEPLGVELQGEEGEVRRDAHDELVGHRARAGERGDEFHPLAGLGPPVAGEGGEHGAVERVAEDAEAVDDDRPRPRLASAAGQPGPHRVEQQSAPSAPDDESGEAARPAGPLRGRGAEASHGGVRISSRSPVGGVFLKRPAPLATLLHGLSGAVGFRTGAAERENLAVAPGPASSPLLFVGSFLSDGFWESVLQPRKILVADDSKLMHKMYEVMLRQYPLVYALDGRQALERLQEHPDIDLVLLDINMPNMNGLEFLAEVRSGEAHKDLAIIIISTEGREQDTQRGLEAGASAYIKKPFHSEDILEKISQLEKGPA